MTDMFTCPSRLLVVLLAGTPVLVALAAPAQPEPVTEVPQGSLLQVNSHDFDPAELPVNLTLL